MKSGPAAASRDLIRKDHVKRWMASEEIECLGALFCLLMDRACYERIDPPLQFADYQGFVQTYLERCLREDPEGEWADSRYEAGWTLAKWFRGLWLDPAVPRSALRELKDWLARLYKEGGQEVRTCLVTASLEHLFEANEIGQFFSDWNQDSDLKKAFVDAMEWQRKSGPLE